MEIKMTINLIFYLIVICAVQAHTSTWKQEKCYDPIKNDTRAITALILARGGSKGIPLKNIQRIDGVSLLGFSITALQEAKKFQSIWVSTDHPAIAQEAERYKVNVHWRSPESASDTASSMDGVSEFLKNHQLVTNLALVQCTSPFIKVKYLRKAIKRIKYFDCVFSVVTSFKLRWKKEKFTKKIVPLNFDVRNRPRRQDWRGELVEAGMFYFSKRSLLDQRLFQNENCRIVKISKRDSIEIDKPIDLHMARMFDKMNQKRYHQHHHHHHHHHQRSGL